MTTRLTKTERIARRRLGYHMWLAQEDMYWVQDIADEVPEAWHTIEADIDCHEPKEKITLYLDKSLARAFKAMGKGYQARINRILCTWLQMKMGGLYNEPMALHMRRTEVLRDERIKYKDEKLPGWGTMVDDA